MSSNGRTPAILVGISVVIIISSLVAYIWPTVFATQGHYNINRLYQAINAGLTGAFLSIIIAIAMTYAFHMYQTNECID